MDETLEHLFDILEIRYEGVKTANPIYHLEVENAIQAIKEYIRNTSVCSNSHHHTAGYDCCN